MEHSIDKTTIISPDGKNGTGFCSGCGKTVEVWQGGKPLSWRCVPEKRRRNRERYRFNAPKRLQVQGTASRKLIIEGDFTVRFE